MMFGAMNSFIKQIHTQVLDKESNPKMQAADEDEIKAILQKKI